jgi:hypothetical protein
MVTNHRQIETGRGHGVDIDRKSFVIKLSHRQKQKQKQKVRRSPKGSGVTGLEFGITLRFWNRNEYRLTILYLGGDSRNEFCYSHKYN